MRIDMQIASRRSKNQNEQTHKEYTQKQQKWTNTNKQSQRHYYTIDRKNIAQTTIHDDHMNIDKTFALLLFSPVLVRQFDRTIETRHSRAHTTI